MIVVAWQQIWVERPTPFADAENFCVWGSADDPAVPHPAGEDVEFERYIPIQTLSRLETAEALARFEFERRERESDLQVKDGPLAWAECEPGLREEMLKWAGEVLDALGREIVSG